MQRIVIIFTILLTGCSHHPPEIAALATWVNPICIIYCVGESEARLQKGNQNQIGDGYEKDP